VLGHALSDSDNKGDFRLDGLNDGSSGEWGRDIYCGRIGAGGFLGLSEKVEVSLNIFFSQYI
jgi:hypothetical protein